MGQTLDTLRTALLGERVKAFVTPEPVRLTAAVVALGVGFYFKNPLLAMVMGGLTLVGGLYWFA